MRWPTSPRRSTTGTRNVRLRLIGINSAHVARSIAKGELEAGLLVLPVDEDGLEVRPLFRDEVLYASATRDPDDGPVTIEEVAAAKLVLYDAFAGWDDPTRRQLLERARLQALSIDPAVEVEHVETALDLVAAGTADTIVSRSIAEADGFPSGVRTFAFSEPMHDTIALVQREGCSCRRRHSDWPSWRRRCCASGFRAPGSHPLDADPLD